MTARMSDARRRAFLEAYAQSGNMTLSAEQAGMSRSWAVKARRSDPVFDRDCRAAKAASAERLAGGGCNRPPKAWKQRGGVDLVVQHGGKRPAQVVRSAAARWTARAEARFLGRLRQCNNARLACRLAGMTLSSYEAHWRRWPDFRRRVAEARAFARLRLEAQMVAERERPVDPDALFDRIDDLPDFPPGLTIADRINLARRAKGEATRRRRRAIRDSGGG